MGRILIIIICRSLELGLLVLRDWADGVIIRDEEVDGERPAVVQVLLQCFQSFWLSFLLKIDDL